MLTTLQIRHWHETSTRHESSNAKDNRPRNIVVRHPEQFPPSKRHLRVICHRLKGAYSAVGAPLIKI